MTKIQKYLKHLDFGFVSSFDIRISDLILYLIILFLPTQLGKHFWPSFSYISGIRVDYLSPTIYLTDILIFSLFIIWLTPIFKNRKEILNTRFAARRVKHKILNIKWILLLVFMLIGIAFSKSPVVGIYGFIKLLEFVFFGFYVSQTQLRTQIITTIFTIGILGESILAIAQFFHHGSLNGLFYFFGERTFTGETPGIANAILNGELVLRPYATFPHPNVLAGYLVIAMAITILNIKNKISNIKKIIYGTSILLGTIALLLTMSRIAIVLWIFILLFYITKFLLNRFSSFISILVVFVCIGSICSILFFSPISSRFTNFRLTDESVILRQQLSTASFEMFKKNPLFGVGLNNFLINLSGAQKPQTSVYSFQPAHNIYLLVLSETGIIGLIFFLWIIMKALRLSVENKFSIFNFQFSIVLFAVLFLGLFDHYFLTLQQGQLLLTFVLGFSLAVKKMVQY